MYSHVVLLSAVAGPTAARRTPAFHPYVVMAKKAKIIFFTTLPLPEMCLIWTGVV